MPPPPPIPLPRPQAHLRNNLNLCTAEGLAAGPIVYLAIPGNFLAALLLTQIFSVGNTAYGLIVSLPAWFNVVQLVITGWLTRHFPQKRITLVFASLNAAVWLALALALPSIPMDDPAAAARVFFLLFGLSSLTFAVTSVSWMSWIQEWIPETLRPRYFGARNRILQVGTLVFALAAGEVMARFEGLHKVEAFQGLLFAVVGLRVLSILGQWRILSSEHFLHVETQLDWPGQLRAIRRMPSLVWFIAFGAAWGFATNFFGPFFNPFLYGTLGLSVGDLALLLVIFNLTGALSLPAWGSLLDRFGNRPVLIVCIVGWMLPSYLWVLAEPGQTGFLKLLYASGGIFGAGFVLGQFNLLLKLVQPEVKTTAIGLNTAATSLMAAVAPILGGAALGWAAHQGIDSLDTFHAFTVVHHTLILLTILLLARVHEPRSGELTQLIGAMRSFREIAGLLGLTLFVNYVFFRRKK